MLNNLSIKNYALIEEMEIGFSEGLTIITGETGAGKSILLGALSLLLGNRADSNSLYSKSKKCIIEGEFDIKGYQLENIFKAHDLDFENKTIIRRELSVDGKSRAFVNDTPVNLSTLKLIGQKLIEIHSQHETLTLNDSAFQMSVVDSIAGTSLNLRDYQIKFNQYTELVRKLNQLKEEQNKAASDYSYFSFLFNELEQANLKYNEQLELESELNFINNSGDIKSALVNASGIFDNDKQSLISQLNSIHSEFSKISRVYPEINELLSRVKSAQIELKDIHSEIEILESSMNFDPSRKELLTDRLDLIYSLQKKHNVSSIDELIDVHTELDRKINAIGSLEESITKLQQDSNKFHDQLIQQAAKIRELRKKALPGIETTIKKLLADLGMKHSVLKIEIHPLPENELRLTGSESVKFLFSANKGVEYKELNKVASGGELSRLMLSIKTLIADYAALPTIIFDEIDTGVSGEIAHKAGNLIKDMSTDRQVITITHLPQMASKGDQHLLVYKDNDGKASKTRIKLLNEQDRIEEIAKMLSGNEPTKSAIANAKELLHV